MNTNLIAQMKSLLASSSAELRKEWAQQVCDQGIPLESLLALLHGEQKTAQRFMWLIGDICERDAEIVRPCMPLLFSLHDQMPFPGMPRSVAKWLGLTNVPKSVEQQAITQLLFWLGDADTSIGCKSYSGRALVELVEQGRVKHEVVVASLMRESRHENSAYAYRAKKLLARIKNN